MQSASLHCNGQTNVHVLAQRLLAACWHAVAFARASRQGGLLAIQDQKAEGTNPDRTAKQRATCAARTALCTSLRFMQSL